MADRLHSSSDVPGFDTDPGSPPVERIDTVPERGNSTLEQRAAELGAAAGKVVHMVKRARAHSKTLADQPMLDRIKGLAEDALARAERLRTVAAERARQWSQTRRDKTAELARQAREKSKELRLRAQSSYDRTRRRSVELAHDYPLHVALAAGAVGFLIGAGLRMRRSHRAH